MGDAHPFNAEEATMRSRYSTMTEQQQRAISSISTNRIHKIENEIFTNFKKSKEAMQIDRLQKERDRLQKQVYDINTMISEIEQKAGINSREGRVYSNDRIMKVNSIAREFEEAIPFILNPNEMLNRFEDFKKAIEAC
jgi:gas vesicle protein